MAASLLLGVCLPCASGAATQVDFGTPVDLSAPVTTPPGFASATTSWSLDNTAQTTAVVTIRAEATARDQLDAGQPVFAQNVVRFEVPYAVLRTLEIDTCSGTCTPEISIPIQKLVVDVTYSGALAEHQETIFDNEGADAFDVVIDPGLPGVDPIAFPDTGGQTNSIVTIDHVGHADDCAVGSFPQAPAGEISSSAEFPLDYRLWTDRFPPRAAYADQSFVQGFDGTLVVELVLEAFSNPPHGSDAVACIGLDSPLPLPHLQAPEGPGLPDCGSGLTVSLGVEDVDTFRMELPALGEHPGRAFFAIDPPAVYTAVRPAALSADGSVVAGTLDAPSGPEAFRWQEGAFILLGDLAGGGFDSVANAVSADGSVVVGRGQSGSGLQAFRWQGGAMSGLAVGSFFSSAVDVSDDGTTILGNRGSVLGAAGFRWENSVVSDLFGPGGSAPLAAAVSGDGSVAVGAGTWDIPPVPPFTTPLRFAGAASETVGATGDYDEDLASSGTFEILGEDGIRALAHGTTADGSIVISRGNASPFNAPTIWDPTHGRRAVDAALRREFGLEAQVRGWILTSLDAISGDGTTLTGTGIDPDGLARAWVAVTPQVVQAPPGAGVFVQALGGAGVVGGVDVTLGSVDEAKGGALMALFLERPLDEALATVDLARWPFLILTDPVQAFEVSFTGAFSGGAAITLHYDDQLPFLPPYTESSFIVLQLVPFFPGCSWGVDCGFVQYVPTTIDTVANTATFTTSLLANPPRMPSTDTLTFDGTAQGGHIKIRVNGVEITVFTSGGQSAEKIAALVAGAINAEQALVAAGITAFADGGTVTTVGEFESVVIFDPGLAPLPIPAVRLPVLLLGGLLLLGAGALVARHIELPSALR